MMPSAARSSSAPLEWQVLDTSDTQEQGLECYWSSPDSSIDDGVHDAAALVVSPPSPSRSILLRRRLKSTLQTVRCKRLVSQFKDKFRRRSVEAVAVGLGCTMGSNLNSGSTKENDRSATSQGDITVSSDETRCGIEDKKMASSESPGVSDETRCGPEQQQQLAPIEPTSPGGSDEQLASSEPMKPGGEPQCGNKAKQLTPREPTPPGATTIVPSTMIHVASKANDGFLECELADAVLEISSTQNDGRNTAGNTVPSPKSKLANCEKASVDRCETQGNINDSSSSPNVSELTADASFQNSENDDDIEYDDSIDEEEDIDFGWFNMLYFYNTMDGDADDVEKDTASF